MKRTITDTQIIPEKLLKEIYTRSAFLSERLNPSLFKPVSHPENAEKAKKRIARWIKMLGQNGESRFKNRLKWNDLTLQKIRPRLGEVSAKQPDLNSEWLRTLKGVMETAMIEGKFLLSEKIPGLSKAQTDLSCKKIPTLSIKGVLSRKKPVPFEDFLLPMLKFARRSLLERFSGEDLPLTRKAYYQLERSLLERVNPLVHETLLAEFQSTLPFHRTIQLMLLKTENKNPSRELYSEFIARNVTDGYKTLFAKYPVLGRLISITINMWIDQAVEFLSRLQKDRSELLKHHSPKPVIDLECDLSDPHHRGRTVFAMTFLGGKKWVYKPKSLQIEVAYLELLSWINGKGLSKPFRVLDVIAKEEYGWIEFVEHRACRSRKEVKDFYHRAGSLLAVLYAMGTTDCHMENLIADRDQLILIDMETASAPHFADFVSKEQKKNSPGTDFSQSVLSSGLLPAWQCVSDSMAQFNVSGLGFSSKMISSGRRLSSINTDEMRYTQQNFPGQPRTNLPFLGKKTALPQNYLAECMKGFEEGYRLLFSQKKELVSKKGPLSSWESGRIRVVIRPTRVYFQLQRQTFRPQFLREGVDWSIEYERLYLAYLDEKKAPRMWGAVSLELDSMHQMDIPYFYSEVGGKALVSSSGGSIDHLYNTSVDEVIRKRVRNLKEKDQRLQTDLTYASFDSQVVPASDKKTAEKYGAWPEKGALSAGKIRTEIFRIADDLTRRAIRPPGKAGIHWIGAQFQETTKNFATSLLGNDLYGGTNGIALFLAAADAEKGGGRYREPVLSALKPFTSRTDFESARKAFRKIPNIPLGLSGMGGDLYSLVSISKFLKKKSLLDVASRRASFLNSRHIKNDETLDIIGGSAGLLLGLLTLYRETEEKKVLGKAILAGEHLLSSRTRIKNGQKAWTTLKEAKEHPLCGYSHGAAGIAYALARLHAVTQQDRFLKGAEDGLRYERSVFSPEKSNWPDFRSMADEGKPSWPNQWCHGAMGIGLGRLGMLPTLDDESIRQEIEIALKTTAEIPFTQQRRDTICCGHAGRADLFLEASRILDRPEFLRITRNRMGAIVTASRKTKSYESILPGFQEPSFFQGLSGIGYQLLRSLSPEKVPSVLLLN